MSKIIQPKNLVTLTRLVRKHTRTIKRISISEQKTASKDILLAAFMHEQTNDLHQYIVRYFRKKYEPMGFEHFKGHDLEMQRDFLWLCLDFTDPYYKFTCFDSITANNVGAKFEKAFMSNVSNQ